jgi:hypothetical protein
VVYAARPLHVRHFLKKSRASPHSSMSRKNEKALRHFSLILSSDEICQVRPFSANGHVKSRSTVYTIRKKPLS